MMTCHSTDYDSTPASCFMYVLVSPPELLIAEWVRCCYWVFFAESVVSVMGFRIEQILITKRILNANAGRCKMFHSLFSDRYNNKREMFYRRYESEFIVE